MLAAAKHLEKARPEAEAEAEAVVMVVVAVVVVASLIRIIARIHQRAPPRPRLVAETTKESWSAVRYGGGLWEWPCRLFSAASYAWSW